MAAGPRASEPDKSKPAKRRKHPKTARQPRTSGAALILPAQLRSSRRRAPTSVDNDMIDCTVFAPPAAPQGANILVQVFAHLPEEDEHVAELAREFDEDAQRRGFKSLGVEIERGATLNFHLSLPGLEIDDTVQSLVWCGVSELVQFAVQVPRQAEPGNIIGTITISKDSVPIGHIKFKFTVRSVGSQNIPTSSQLLGEAHAYHRAFVSYASQDRNEVLKRVQMLARLRIGFFQDLMSLEPGDRWEKQLYRHIDESDLFLLFWSQAAKQSEWVMKELRYALKRKGDDDSAPPEIIPVPIEGPPLVEPPEELAHIHFDDYFLYFINAQPERT